MVRKLISSQQEDTLPSILNKLYTLPPHTFSHQDRYVSNLINWIHDPKEMTPISFKVMAVSKIIKTALSQSRGLNLANLSLKSIPPLFGLPNLIKLNLKNNAIDFMPSDAFLNLKNLKTLLLSFNPIYTLRHINFSHCPELSFLIAKQMNLSSMDDLPNGSQLSNLDHLSIEKNNISEIRNWKLTYPKLKSLYLSENPITILENVNCSEHAHIKHIIMKNIPLQIIQNMNYASCKQLSSIELSIQKENNNENSLSIKNLNFSKCEKLSALSLPSETRSIDTLNLSDCHTIETLKICPNQLREFKNLDVSHCNRLTRILVHHTQISHIFGWNLTGCTHLSHLSLHSNRLQDLNDLNLTDCIALDRITLYNNDLVELNFRLPRRTLQILNIDISYNRFSISRLDDLNSQQNSPTYQGPVYTLSLYTLPKFTHQLTDLPRAITDWGHQADHPLWKKISTTPNGDPLYSVYLNFVIFLARLFNETPRENEFNKPAVAVQNQVDMILTHLESNPSSENHLLMICGTMSEYVETCVDRLGVGLIHISVLTQLDQAQTEKNASQILCLKNQIAWIDRVISFVHDVSSYKIIFNQKTQKFYSIKSETIMDEGYELTLDDASIIQREAYIQNLQDKGQSVCVFYMKEEIEDILLILNNLKSEKIISIEGVEMKFKACATLRDEKLQKASIDFLKETYLSPA